MLAAIVAATPALALAQDAAKPPTQAAKPAVPAKKMQQGEYDMYNAALVDIGKNPPDFTKALADLDAWKQKFPTSDYAVDGKVQYIRAYAGAKQPAKAIDMAGELLSGNIDSLFPDPKGGPGLVLAVLMTASQSAIGMVQANTPLTADETATVRKAADMLLHYNRKAEGYTDDQWAQLHVQVDPLARQALYSVTVAPGIEALQKKDYATAEDAFRKALQQYPENATVAFNLAATLVGEYIADPSANGKKFPEALYLYARAASVDPKTGGVTPEWQTNGPAKSLTTYYTQFHGSTEGMDDLKALAAKSPAPPEGFTIKSGVEIEKEKNDAFVAAHPDLARWLEIKKLLTTGGESYFKESMADAAMPKLKGKLLEGKPACNSKELIVALSDDTTPEVTLKLDTPLKGKPATGVDITYEGAVAKAFTASPFNLTMEMEQAKIDGLEKSPCAAAPGTKKAAPPATKKQ
jgi:tetratricopeptide (TPR) repeat protein